MFANDESTHPVGSTVNQWFGILINKKSLAAAIFHHNWIIGALWDLELC